MSTEELNAIVIEAKKMIEEVFEFLGGKNDLIDKIPNTIETTGLYKNFKQAMQIEKEKEICIEKLLYILKFIDDIMPGYCLEKYGYEFKSYNDAVSFLKCKPFYSKEEQQKAFQLQFLQACTEQIPNLCLRNGLILKFFNGSEKVFQTEDALKEYLDQSMGIYCIIVNTQNLEEEYQKYCNHLLQHGHEYTGNNEKFPWGCIAETLAHHFGGQVEFWGFPFFTIDFHYPYDFDNKEYIECIEKIAKMRKNKDFMRAYKLYGCVKNMIKKLDLGSHYEKLCNECFNSVNIVCPQNIVFLQRLYHYNETFDMYTEIDYYKVLDVDAYRNLLDHNHIGSWKYVNDKCLSSRYFPNPKRNLLGVSSRNGTMFGGDYRINSLSSYEENRLLYDEINSAEVYDTEKNNHSIENKIIIVSNEKLNYDTLLEEYYANTGMNALEFSQMVREKYNCEVIVPEVNTAKTRLMVYPNNK